MHSFEPFKPRMYQLRTVIKRGENYYFVSTNDTFDKGFVTMVFPFDLYDGKVTSWGELGSAHYDTVEQATHGHWHMVENFTI